MKLFETPYSYSATSRLLQASPSWSVLIMNLLVYCNTIIGKLQSILHCFFNHVPHYPHVSTALLSTATRFKALENTLHGHYCRHASRYGTLDIVSGVPAQVPSWCFYHEVGRIAHYHNTGLTTIVLFFLGFSYLSKVLQLFNTTQQRAHKYLRTRPSEIFRAGLGSIRHRAIQLLAKSSKIFWAIINEIPLSIYCILKAAADLYGSLLWEVSLQQILSVALRVLTSKPDHLVVNDTDMEDCHNCYLPQCTRRGEQDRIS